MVDSSEISTARKDQPLVASVHLGGSLDGVVQPKMLEQKESSMIDQTVACVTAIDGKDERGAGQLLYQEWRDCF